MEIITKSAHETKEAGRKLGSSLKGGEVIGLVGNLGSGKTTFIQGLAKGIGSGDRINSPTFIIAREYPNKFGGHLYHVDLYRLETSLKEKLTQLGLFDFMKNKKNITVVEWAGKARDLLPKSTIWIEFSNLGEDKRRIVVNK